MSGCHGAAQGRRARGAELEVEWLGFRRPESQELACFEQLQEPALDVERQRSDFVEEQRARRGCVCVPLAVACAGDRAAA
jgi:hypothetical protein